MRNFFGRILILLASIINIILILVIGCSAVFDLATRTEDFNLAYNGGNQLVNIIDASLFFLFFIAFIVLTIWCIKNIATARPMKQNLIGTNVLLVIEITYFTYHLSVPGVLITNLGLFIGVGMTYFLTTLALLTGCIANFYKDCNN